MGLFGSIGKVFGGALKIAGKVAGVASTVAPIPGLGFAGKLASGVGKALTVAKRVDAVMPGGAPARAVPNVINTVEVLREAKMSMTGNITLPPALARTAPPLMVAPRASALPIIGEPPAAAPRKRRKKKRATRRRATRRASSRRKGKKRRRYTRAQLRAGFGGKRRKRR